MTSFRFDHAVILVADLDRAVADYRALGFTVTPGGSHTGGATRNALIAFRDGSYLELLAFTGRLSWMLRWLRRAGLASRLAKNRTGLERRFLLQAGLGEGLIDFALLPSALESDLARARSAGLEAEGPLPGGRVRPDGEEVAWLLGVPRTRDLPFLCADVTPRELRVPEGEARQHANGVVGTAGVVVAVRNLEASSARYRAMLGVDPILKVDPALARSRTRVFPVGDGEITLAAPGGGSDPLRVRLKHGDGPYVIRLRYADSRPVLDLARAHGARLEPVALS